MENIFLDATDGHKIPIYIERAKEEKAVLQFVHDSLDDSTRFFDIMNEFKNRGITTIISDNRGHNRAVTKPDNLLYFGEHNGWNNCVDDLHKVNQYIDSFTRAPKFILGVGIGALLVRTFVFKFGHSVNGAIIVASLPYLDKIHQKIFDFIISFNISKYGERYRSSIFYDKIFTHLNKDFKGQLGTEYISSDISVQDQFRKNPLTNGVPTLSLYHDILRGVNMVQKSDSISYIPNSLPLLFMAGTDDPMAGGIKKQKRLVTIYSSKGKNAELVLFKGARHDIFHDISRKSAIDEVVKLIESSK